MLPLRMPTTPTVCDGDGQATVLGVDLGIVRLATAKHPNGLFIASGRPIRYRRERFAALRRRMQRHDRIDRVRAMKGRESCWMRDVNHQVSRQLVDLARQYPHPVLALEKLDGIRDRVRGSRRFNRMVSSWAFRQLVDFIEYKAAKAGVRVVYVDPRKTSRTCPKCGHATRANRPEQSHFRCVACGYQGNADVVASLNIAGVAAGLLRQGPPDTARLGVAGSGSRFGRTRWPYTHHQAVALLTPYLRARVLALVPVTLFFSSKATPIALHTPAKTKRGIGLSCRKHRSLIRFILPSSPGVTVSPVV